MDSALLLLWRLRLKAFFRRWAKNLRSVKGIALTLVGLLVFVPWLISTFVAQKAGPPIELMVVRRFGPLALLAYTFLSLILSTGERALFFTPAEVAFLFSGPFSRKSLLRYKVVGIVWGCLFSSLFLSIALGRPNRNLLVSYMVIALTLFFFQTLSMAVGLASNSIAALAHNVRRRLVLAVLLGLIVATVAPAGFGLLSLTWVEALERLESSPILKAAVLPFKPFVLAYTAERIWPDFVSWLAVCLALIGGMLALVFAVDAQYLESAATSSARIYDQIQKMRKGGLAGSSSRPKNTRVRVAMLPWWGGVGPILWRQLSTAAREPFRVIFVCLMVLVPGGVMLYGMIAHPNPDRTALVMGPVMSLIMSLWISIYLSPLVAFDFRGDIDRMEELKTLPTPPSALVLGQVLTPVMIFTVPQWLGFGLASIWLGVVNVEYWATLAMALPATFLMFGIENLMFLLFPTRATVANPADFAAFGRQILLIMSKVFGVCLTLGASALVGFGAYSLLGAGRGVSLAISFCVASGFAVALVPLIVMAFLRYDVARDTPA